MNEPIEGPPAGNPEENKLFPILRGGDLGFHYTMVDALSDTFEHGLLSRDEERKRGLEVRARASRSMSDTIYFTTQVEDLYFVKRDENEDLQATLGDVVGIAIDRPGYAREHKGHFGEENVVEPFKFRVLVIVDRKAVGGSKYYEFPEALPEKVIKQRVQRVRKLCEEKGVNLPIYGVSGDMYWPERKTREEIRLSRFK